MKAPKRRILVIGSDILAPPSTMEARMVRLAIIDLQNVADVTLLSIEYGQSNESRKPHSNETALTIGWFGGPAWFRKLRYLSIFILTVLRLSRRKYDTCWFVWVGFPVLTQWAIRRFRGAGSFVITTVLSRSASPKRYCDSDAIVVHSQSLRNVYSSYQHKCIRLIPPPCNVSQAQVDLSIHKPLPYFVFASGPRTKAQIMDRGVILLFTASRLLRKNGTYIGIKFLNRWPDGYAILEKLRSDNQADDVEIFNGYCHDIGSLIARGLGVVVPYLNTDQGDVPLSAIESWSVGRPIVSTAMPSLVHLIGEYSVGAVSDSSPDAFASAMQNVASTVMSRRDSCLTVARHFDPSKYVTEYRKLLLEQQ